MQYWRLIHLPNLLPMSRFQLIWAILMFLGVPAMTLMITLSPVAVMQAGPNFPSALAAFLYLTFLAMFLAPKIAGLMDILLTKGGAKQYGGALRLMVGGAAEIIFSFLLGAITTFRLTFFMLALPFGHKVSWNGQIRDGAGLSWKEAATGLWQPCLFGIVLCALLYALSSSVFMWSLPLTLGYLTAIPFAVVTSSPKVGAWLKHFNIAAIPEDIAPPIEIQMLNQKAAL
jgi:membrane glycosyltransferase